MPRGDRTGPSGYGPRTGRSAGFCAGYDRPGFLSGRGGYGFYGGPGRGFGRGYRARMGGYMPGPGYYAEGMAPDFIAAPPAENEKDWLENKAAALKNELKSIEDRMEQLEENQK